jgi:curved DNA-binding protein CbpA
VANPAHLEKLCEGPKAWNEWRDANPNEVPDLTEIKLTLHQRQLGPSNGGPVDLRLADLEHASLPYATLSGADLEGARLVGADLTHARLDGAKLSGADLTDAMLDQADLTGAVLDQAVLFGAKLSGIRNLTAAQLENAYGDASTTLPDNILPPHSWFPNEDYGDEDDYAGWGMAAPYEQPEQDLYEALGLAQNASPEEIRSSYRTLVKKLHPDLNPNDQAAQERFKQVTTAYRILNDQAQRQRYDRGEIDGEGRVNPEFEARRRFRRAAFRYYAAAAGSFVVAAGALAAVWLTVLSVPPEDSSAVAVVLPPKRAERLGDGPAQEKLVTTEQSTSTRHIAAAPQDAAPSLTSPEVESAPPSPPPSLAEGMAEVRKEATAEPKLNIAIETVAPKPAASSNVPSAQEEQNRERPKPSEPSGDDRAASQLAPRAPQGGENVRLPLSRQHKEAAGQTAPSAPERWSVGAISQQAGTERKASPAPNSNGLAVGGERLPPPAQWPLARDMVSTVLRDRALRQGQAKDRRSLTASEAAPFPERRAPFFPSGPITTTSTKPRAVPVKRPPAIQQQQPQQQRKPQMVRQATRPQATASNASVPFEETR